MKKLLIQLSLILVLAIPAQGQILNATQLKKTVAGFDTTVSLLNGFSIDYMVKGTNTQVNYKYTEASGKQKTKPITVSQPLDTLVKHLNKNGPYFVKLSWLTTIGSRDTSYIVGFPVFGLEEAVSVSVPLRPAIKSRYTLGTQTFYLGETLTRIKAIQDSTIDASRSALRLEVRGQDTTYFIRSVAGPDTLVTVYSGAAGTVTRKDTIARK